MKERPFGAKFNKSGKLVAFNINRSKWRSGEGHDGETGEGKTFLRNDNGYMCCLGFCARAIGFKTDEILNVADLNKLSLNKPDSTTRLNRLPSFDSGQAVDINDYPVGEHTNRETEITKFFLKNGIKVKFIGNYRR